jgi:3-carboxy-cis,cis-muconate cycloisomerase
MSGHLYQRVLATPDIEAVFSDGALIAAMVRFETALARAQAAIGIVPREAAAAIGRCAAGFSPDAQQLVRDGAHAGSLAIPFVKAFAAHVAEHDKDAAEYVHYGTTSQDVLDTALALCTAEAVQLLQREVAWAYRSAVALAKRHAATPMLARTLLQPAGVTTLGFKAAQWALALARGQQRTANSAQQALAVSLGGATGNLAFFGERGAALRAQTATLLGLYDPGYSWHAARDAWIALAADVGLLCGTIGKIGRDLALLSQAEIGEVAEPQVAGRGGSTAMPHKRNPVLSMRVIAAAQSTPGIVANLLSAMPQEHERALGNWQAELALWPAIFISAASGAQALADLLEGLQVNAERCRKNIAAHNGVVFAERLAQLLSPALGKVEATKLVAALCARAQSADTELRDLARDLVQRDPRLTLLSTGALEQIFSIDEAAQASANLVPSLLGANHDVGDSR